MTFLVISKRTSVDFVLIDTYSTANFYYALIISQLCRIFKIKYIPILHGGNLEERLKSSRYFSRIIFRYAYKMVAPSNFLKTVFETYGYDDVTYIPNTIEIENYKYQPREIDVLKLLWVRSFSKIYNPEQAILVLDSLLKKGFKAELTMVGPDVDGSLRTVKQLAEDKSLKVNFPGKLAKLEWVELSKKYSLFINTTNFDNTPVSVIEAMALGLPIVSTNVGGIPYLVSKDIDGMLVPANDVEAMVKAIVELKENKNLKDRLVANAREKVEQFNWEVVKPKWESLLT